MEKHYPVLEGKASYFKLLLLAAKAGFLGSVVATLILWNTWGDEPWTFKLAWAAAIYLIYLLWSATQINKDRTGFNIRFW